jgi:uncharacterized protein YjiS (DUF1127 family)
MSIYETFETHGHNIAMPNFAFLRERASALWTSFMTRLQERRTYRILSNLDPSVLEDIGVPHTDVRLSVGKLERYPRIISVKRLREIVRI